MFGLGEGGTKVEFGIAVVTIDVVVGNSVVVVVVVKGMTVGSKVDKTVVLVVAVVVGDAVRTVVLGAKEVEVVAVEVLVVVLVVLVVVVVVVVCSMYVVGRM